MADTSNLSKFLTDVADAIRTKKETTEPIAAEQFDQEILSIETGIDTSDATASATDIVYGKIAYGNDGKIVGTVQEVKSGSQTGVGTLRGFYDNSAITGKVQVTTNTEYEKLYRVGSILTQDIPAETVAQKIGLTPDKLMKGNTILNIEGAAEGGGGDTSDATATANDILLGKTAYVKNGKVTGTLKGARYYATEEEMYADTTVEPVTYGLIYSEINEPLKNGDSVRVMKFPNVVVLDTAVTSSRSGQVMGYENDIYLNLMVAYAKTYVDIMSMEGDIRVEYTSTDGITYTKTAGVDEYDLGGSVTVDDFENLLDVLGHFMIRTSYYQGGLYKYDTYIEENKVKLFDTNTQQLTEELFELPQELIGQESGGHLGYAIIKTYHYDESRKVNVVDTADLVGALYNNYLAKNGSTFCIVAEDLMFDSVKHYDFSLSNPLVSTDKLSVLGTYNGKNIYYNIPSGHHLVFGSANINPLEYVSSPGATAVSFKQHPMNWTGYKLAGNQYNLVKANQLLPGIQAYGKTGIVTGDGSIYDNLDATEIVKNFFGVSEEELKASFSRYDEVQNYKVGQRLCLSTGSGIVKSGKVYHLKDFDIKTKGSKNDAMLKYYQHKTRMGHKASSSSGSVYLSVDPINEYMIDCVYYSSNSVAYISVGDYNGNIVKEFTIPIAYGKNAYDKMCYANGIFYSWCATGLYRYNTSTSSGSLIYSSTASAKSMFYDSELNKIYASVSGSNKCDIYEIDGTSGARTTLATGAGILIGTKLGISYNTSNQCRAKAVGSTSWISCTSTEVPQSSTSNSYGRCACVGADGCMYAVTLFDSSTQVGEIHKIDFASGTVKQLTQGLVRFPGYCNSGGCGAYDEHTIYAISRTGGLYLYDLDNNKWISIQTGSLIPEYEICFLEFVTPTRFKRLGWYVGVSVYPSYDRDYGWSEYELVDVELGVSDTELNFVSNSGGTKNFFVGNPLEALDEPEYNTALETAQDILGKEVTE